MDDGLDSKLVINMSRVEAPEAKISLKLNEPSDINIRNIINNDHKEFDGFYMTYHKNKGSQPLLNKWEAVKGISYE